MRSGSGALSTRGTNLDTAGYMCLHINHRSVNFEPLMAKMDFLFGENGLFANEINL